MVKKERWGNLRDQYKKHMNKRKTKSGQGATTLKKYKYEKNLNFLFPHVQDRHTITSIESENEQTQDASKAEKSPQNTTQDESELFNNDTDITELTPNFQPTAQFTRPKNRIKKVRKYIISAFCL